jgi:hypothetical protein
MNVNGAPTLFAGIPGAQKMGSNRGAGGVNWAAIEAAFEYATEVLGVDWGETVTLEQASTLRQIAKSAGLDEKVERVQGWFTNWYMYYPFVDGVAVRRAVDFEPSVWSNLTARERHEVLVRLAEHPDPWAEQSYYGGGRGQQGATGRALRWLSFTDRERKPLFQAVKYQKSLL